MKKALLVGINDYQRPRINDLNGCINDVKDMGDTILSFYGFERRNVKLLTDWEATKANILKGINWHIKGAKQGDILLFHYSGHGSQIPDIGEKDEEDHLDECFCPSDINLRPFSESCIVDDELQDKFSRIPKGVNLTVILDSCHSGTATREIELGMETRIGRFFPPPFDLAWLIDDRIRGRRRKFGIDPSKERNILLAACKEYQTSIDTWIGGGYHGAFTYFLTQTIREVKGNITYRELIKRTGKKLEEHGFDQLPQLEGQERYFDTPFLSSLE